MDIAERKVMGGSIKPGLLTPREHDALLIYMGARKQHMLDHEGNEDAQGNLYEAVAQVMGITNGRAGSYVRMAIKKVAWDGNGV